MTAIVNEDHTFEDLRIVQLIKIQGDQKLAHFLYALTLCALTLSNIDRFQNLFHCLNQEKFIIMISLKDPTTPQLCRYTLKIGQY